jgi:hypothetical protein
MTDDSSPKPAKRFQYSLRLLLIVTFVICAYLAVELNRGARQRRTAARLLELGGVVRFNTFGQVTHVTLGSESTFGDAEMPQLADLSDLGSLTIQQPNITDAQMRILAGLKGLMLLDLKGTQATDAVVDHLIGLKNLRLVILHDTGVTAEGCRRLKDALPEALILGPIVPSAPPPRLSRSG